MSIFPHQSVLLNETIQIFKNKNLKRFVDGTLGAAGHSFALLQAHPEIECLIGVDQDPDALAIAEERLSIYGERFRPVRGNFVHLREHLSSLNIESVDGILLDLGVSSMHLDRPDRGFSFRLDGPLDMRMDPSQDLTAEELVNTWTEQELGRIFREYGEEKRWRAAARAVVQARTEQRITRTQELASLLHPVLIKGHKKKTHPATRVFQGIRIAVNRELEVLEAILPEAIDLLSPGGVLGIISFHSLEDRMVKRFFQQAASDKEQTQGLAGLFLDKDPLVNLLTRKPLVATEEEIEENPRSRSARLRAVEKI